MTEKLGMTLDRIRKSIAQAHKMGPVYLSESENWQKNYGGQKKGNGSRFKEVEEAIDAMEVGDSLPWRVDTDSLGGYMGFMNRYRRRNENKKVSSRYNYREEILTLKRVF